MTTERTPVKAPLVWKVCDGYVSGFDIGHVVSTTTGERVLSFIREADYQALKRHLDEYHQEGVQKERQAFREFIKASIANRRRWADSEEGMKALGPGSPTIPGLQDLCFILDWINARY